ncbi:unnamed protein product [Urochloa decumbens]|uniref:F-box domain-containing protein n=1 Tax=Urochloa decumbens TaxID=240449 RepID=A0ABC9BX19_9POAL
MDTPSGKRAKALDAAGDRISGLPDEVRHHVLSFLPARDAARTCVLSPRWRHLWASALRLNVDTKGFTSQAAFVKFVTALLLSRGCTPLDSFCLDANGPDIYLNDFYDTASLWICHALRSNVQTLSITDHDRNDAFEEINDFEDDPDAFHIEHCPFTSSYLKRLHLCGVLILNCFLKNLFSGCPALEDLDMTNCAIIGTKFSSGTLKNLSIDFDNFPDCQGYGYEDIVINMPSLVSLHIGALLGALPSLEDVQSLRTASICLDVQGAAFSDACDILGALSNVKNLELLFLCGVNGKYSLGSDMHLCQVSFTNLTALSISDWCLHDNCKSLLYMLEHSPNLEELTLKIMEPNSRKEDEWSCSISAREKTVTAFNCEKLKKVEIICPRGDRRVGKLVTILLAKIIFAPEISIKPISGLPWYQYSDKKWTVWS